MARHRFARKRCRVELRRALDDDAIKRHALAGLHHDLVAYADLVRVYLHQLPVAHDVGVIGRNVHHVGDALTRLAHRIALEQLAHLVEQHHRCTLGHVRLRVREQHQGKSAHRGDGHEEVLVEHLTVNDVAHRFVQHIVACDKKRDKVQSELKVQRVRFAANILR